MKNIKLIIFIAIIPMACFLYSCANTSSVARVHPEAVTGLPDCTECHTDSWSALNHKANDFYAKHRFYASQLYACNACHAQSFCADCHAHKEEIKPSTKFSDSVERSLPHRGDYLSQHRIDGKIDPVSCAKCHGRQNNERCKTCHR